MEPAPADDEVDGAGGLLDGWEDVPAGDDLLPALVVGGLADLVAEVGWEDDAAPFPDPVPMELGSTVTMFVTVTAASFAPLVHPLITNDAVTSSAATTSRRRRCAIDGSPHWIAWNGGRAGARSTSRYPSMIPDAQPCNRTGDDLRPDNRATRAAGGSDRSVTRVIGYLEDR